MSHVFAIDPGSSETGWVLMDANDMRPSDFGIMDNETFIGYLKAQVVKMLDAMFVCEKIVAQGMIEKKQVMETCQFTGRIQEVCDPVFVPRREVKMWHCGTPAAKDSNVIAALVARYGDKKDKYSKGTKKDPGIFYGFKDDIWQAYAVGAWYIESERAQGL